MLDNCGTGDFTYLFFSSLVVLIVIFNCSTKYLNFGTCDGCYIGQLKRTPQI